MPRTVTVTFGDGSTHVYQGVPDEVSPVDIEARASKDFGKPVTGLDGGKAASGPAIDAPKKENAGTLTNIGAGALKAASDIGSTILWPIDAAHDLIDPQQRNLSDLVTGNKPKSRHEQRKEALQQF